MERLLVFTIIQVTSIAPRGSKGL